MAFQDSAGNKFTNHSAMKSSEARLGAKAPVAHTPDAAPEPEQDILQSPEVQQVFQALAAAGVSPEEVSEAYSQVSGDGAVPSHDAEPMQ